MSTDITTTNNGHTGAALEAVIVGGDLAKLTPEQRVEYYLMRCEAAGLDPRTQPFQYITLQGKLTLYASKTATEQLCARRSITTAIVGRDRADDLYIVTCRASADGRYTESIGAVSIAGLRGDALANALMKAETKAKRRAVLSLSGLGMLDELEVATIPGASTMVVDGETGEVLTVPALPAPEPPHARQEPAPAAAAPQTRPSANGGSNGHQAPDRAKPACVTKNETAYYVDLYTLCTSMEAVAAADAELAAAPVRYARKPEVIEARSCAVAELAKAATDWTDADLTPDDALAPVADAEARAHAEAARDREVIEGFVAAAPAVAS